jgi:hypothetical protein
MPLPADHCAHCDHEDVLQTVGLPIGSPIRILALCMQRETAKQGVYVLQFVFLRSNSVDFSITKQLQNGSVNRRLQSARLSYRRPGRWRVLVPVRASGSSL